MNHYFPKVGETTAEERQRKWRSVRDRFVRDRFVRETKKVKERKSGDPGPPYTPVWELYGMGTLWHANIPQGPDQTQKLSLMN